MLVAVLAVVGEAAAAPSAGAAQPVLELDPAERFEAEPFSRIRGLVELTAGVVVVVDQLENAVYRVDLTRGLRERIGRTGAGPGEYDGPTGIGPWAGDSVLVSDLGNGRLAVLGPDLQMGRTMPMFGEHYSLPRATDERGRMYFDRSTSLRVARREGRASGDLAAIVRWDGTAGRADTVGHVRVPADDPGPFPTRDYWGVGPDGRIVIARNQEDYRVDWVLPDGRELAGPVIDEARVPLRDRDRELWLERNPGGGSTISMGGQAARRPAAPAFPDRFPYVPWQGVHVDGRGLAWVERHQPLEESRPLLDVFDGRGRRIARVRLPPGRRVIGFGAGGLWAVRVDEVDLQWLERYDTGVLTGGR